MVLNLKALLYSGVKKNATNRRASQPAKATQQQLTSPHGDGNELNFSIHNFGGIHRGQDEAVFEGM